jgi:pimeloyl-ACP methyl ester carboxylesterase
MAARWGLEGARAVGDIGLLAAAAPLLATSPRGDGHTVLVLPGLAADDASTRPLRGFLRTLGYDVLGWGLGRNRGWNLDTRRGLADALKAAYERRGTPVSLVGWSMGGIYARELARVSPQAVRHVVTLGSPIDGPIDVPATSIYSRSDVIVPWRRSIQPPGSRVENIEVSASHLSLGHNAAVLHVVADRLAQRPGTWTPFVPRGPWSAWFPATMRRSA